MKRLLATASILLICNTAAAQSPMSMSEQDMQRMMAAMQEVQTCFQKIDQAEINALQQRAVKIHDEVQAMCTKGDRAGAEKRAMSYYREMMKNDTVKKVQACSEKLPEAVKSMAQGPTDYEQYAEQLNDHLCDN